jgi:hypothetical protein
VKSAEEMVVRFSAELVANLPVWKSRIQADPASLEKLEQDVHAAFARGADFVVAGLLALVMQQREFAETTEATRRDFTLPLRQGRERQIQVRLLGGMLIWVTSLYCAVRRSVSASSKERTRGVYVELSQFGFGKGCSPALESAVARQAALCPSFQFAAEELQRRSVKVDVKAVRRIGTQCGNGFLGLRAYELDLWRAGMLPAGTELKGKRVSVQFDGGRVRLRGPLRDAPAKRESLNAEGLPSENVPGRSRRRFQKTFDADWREPKLVTIFVHDEHGRMEKRTQATIDGTFEGPDALAEMIAMHLHRLGAAEALSVTFVADGATWIWDRIPVIIQKAGLEKVPTHEVLDCCHATHHVSLALAALGVSEKERMPMYREHRTLLRNGHWRQVVEELTELAKEFPDHESIQTEIAYLTKHGEAGRLKYPTFRAAGLPLGSGAIESGIRRVINLRLKGNGIFWDQSNAEAMLQLRAQVITGRWDERVRAMRRHELRHGRNDWRRAPQPMSKKAEAESTNPIKP